MRPGMRLQAMVHGYHVAFLVLAIATGAPGVLAGLLIEAYPAAQTPARQEKAEAAPRPAQAG